MPKKHWLFLLIVSIPALAVWIFWYQSNWKWMLICMLFATPIMLIDTIIRQPVKLRVPSLISQLTFYLVLFIYVFARFYQDIGLLKSGEITHSFQEALYFSVATWTTLGAGDLLPVQDLKYWVATQALFSYFFMAILVATIIAQLKIGGSASET